VDDVQVGGDAVRHRHRRTHPVEGRVRPCAIDDRAIGELQPLAQLLEQRVFLVAAQVQEPLEGVEHEPLDALDRQGAGTLARGVAPHPVGDDEQVALLPGEVGLPRAPGQARLADGQRLGQAGDQVMVFVVGPDLSRVGQGAEFDAEARRRPPAGRRQRYRALTRRADGRLLAQHGRVSTPDASIAWMRRGMMVQSRGQNWQLREERGFSRDLHPSRGMLTPSGKRTSHTGASRPHAESRKER